MAWLLDTNILSEGRKPKPDAHGLTVVTRDSSDFDMARVSVFNPWDE